MTDRTKLRCVNGCPRDAAVKGECRTCYLYRWRHGYSRVDAIAHRKPRVRKKLEPLEEIRVRRALREFERTTFRRLIDRGSTP